MIVPNYVTVYYMYIKNIILYMLKCTMYIQCYKIL